MTTATIESFTVGDRVYLAYDPGQEEGVIVQATPNKAQWVVSWASGKTWIYPSVDLVRVAS